MAGQTRAYEHARRQGMNETGGGIRRKVQNSGGEGDSVRVNIPKEIRFLLAVDDGDIVEWQVTDDGDITITPVPDEDRS